MHRAEAFQHCNTTSVEGDPETEQAPPPPSSDGEGEARTAPRVAARAGQLFGNLGILHCVKDIYLQQALVREILLGFHPSGPRQDRHRCARQATPRLGMVS